MEVKRPDAWRAWRGGDTTPHPVLVRKTTTGLYTGQIDERKYKVQIKSSSIEILTRLF